MKFAFSKYQGTGNDFILIDDGERRFPQDPEEIKRICDRRYGIGADGLILIRSKENFDFFNADGSPAEMCGNGLRCFVRYLADHGLKQKKMAVTVHGKLYEASLEGGEVVIDMGQPKIAEEKKILEGLEYYHVNSGVPHFVHFCDEVDQSGFAPKARMLRFHPHFSPFGINVNFAKLFSSNHLLIRTYERGVEGETFSCGTGAAAVCVAAWKQFGISGRITVEFLSQERLHFDLLTSNNELKKVYMRGNAQGVFQGEIDVNRNSERN